MIPYTTDAKGIQLTAHVFLATTMHYNKASRACSALCVILATKPEASTDIFNNVITLCYYNIIELCISQSLKTNTNDSTFDCDLIASSYT
jgi:hypothetical protein